MKNIKKLKNLRWSFYAGLKMSVLCNKYDEEVEHFKVVKGIGETYSALKDMLIVRGYKHKFLAEELMAWLNDHLRPFLTKWDYRLSVNKNKDEINNGVIVKEDIKKEFKDDLEKAQKESKELTEKLYKQINAFIIDRILTKMKETIK